MIRTQNYHSPLGSMLLASNGRALVGAWFDQQKHYAAGLDKKTLVNETDEVLKIAAAWLDRYFAGQVLSAPQVPLELQATEFRQAVLEKLSQVSFGQVITYQELALRVKGPATGKKYARAVANAVGHNPFSLFIPCHRIIGSNGSLTGYAGGLERKRKLLEFESHAGPDFWK